MAYSNFKTIGQIETKFEIISFEKKLFEKITPVEPSQWLKTTLLYSSFTRSKNEKSKSETIVSPILTELVKLNKDFITLFSGNNLEVEPENDLNGECDFIISKDVGRYSLKSPIFHIVEAKEHDIKLGIPQCVAQMHAANLFNKKDNTNIDCIYGCVTTGDDWLFLKLCEKDLFIDKKKYYLNEVDKILGVFQTIIDTFK